MMVYKPLHNKWENNLIRHKWTQKLKQELNLRFGAGSVQVQALVVHAQQEQSGQEILIKNECEERKSWFGLPKVKAISK